MKKFFIMLALLLAVNTGVSARIADETNNMEMVERFNLNVNHKKLAETLELDKEQIDFVDFAIDELENDMMFASTIENNDTQYGVLKSLVEKNMKLMRSFLTPKQYKKYSMLLNLTLVNRGFEMQKLTK